jgi:hypothetical protein
MIEYEDGSNEIIDVNGKHVGMIHKRGYSVNSKLTKEKNEQMDTLSILIVGKPKSLIRAIQFELSLLLNKYVKE